VPTIDDPAHVPILGRRMGGELRYLAFVSSGAVSDRDQFLRAEDPDRCVGESADFLAGLLMGFCGFMDEVGLTGEASPVDRAGHGPYVPNTHMPAGFTHDALQSAGDRGERLLVQAQSGSGPLYFHVKASQGNFRHDHIDIGQRD
jgi:hypothetical protein